MDLLKMFRKQVKLMTDYYKGEDGLWYFSWWTTDHKKAETWGPYEKWESAKDCQSRFLSQFGRESIDRTQLMQELGQFFSDRKLA